MKFSTLLKWVGYATAILSLIAGVRELCENFTAGQQIKVRATAGGKAKEFSAIVRIDTPQEAQYYANGGILQFVLRQLLSSQPEAVNA